MNSVSLSHISEVYLYEYYIAPNEAYEINDNSEIESFINDAKSLMARGNINEALQKWLKANVENPVNMEIILQIISCCKQLGDIQGEYTYTIMSYNYSCTRAELAAYYRNLGWYYLESYKPEISAACYRYSMLFDDTKQADNEIKFLEKAMKHPMAEYPIEKLQEILKENKIPIEANNITLALLYKAGEEAETKKMFDQALDCYRMVYDLTQDKEVGYRINILSNTKMYP